MSMKSETLSKASSKAVEPALEALRSRYQDQLTEYEEAAISARSQLDHIEALLFHVSVAPVRSFDTSSLQPAQTKTKSTAISSPAATSAPVATPAQKAQKAPKASAVATKPAKTAKAVKTAKPAPNAAKMAAITKAPVGRGKRAGIAVATKVESPKATSKGKGKAVKDGKLTMKDSYQGKTMLDAIGMVLKANVGKAVSADSVVNSLYGALSDDQFRVAKDRVTKSLSKGKIDAMWDRVPNQLGVYTISAGSLK
jgi:hypothetical protein